MIAFFLRATSIIFEMKKSSRRSNCPVACTLDLLGDKWTLLIVRDLFLGKHTFDEFMESPEGIATNILTARLNHLREQKLVRRLKDPLDGRRVTYELTDEGRQLGLLLKAVASWGLEHFPGTKAALDVARFKHV